MVDFTEDLRRNSVTWVLYDKAAFPDGPQAATVAQLNTTNPALKLDITCALDEETTTLTLGSSDLDERLSFCDGIGKARPAGTKPELAFGIYRDKDRMATGLYNEVLNWLKHEDFSFYVVERVGPQDSGPTGTLPGEGAKPFEVTDDIRLGSFKTDFPVDTLSGEDPAMLTINPIEDGFLLWNKKPLA